MKHKIHILNVTFISLLTLANPAISANQQLCTPAPSFPFQNVTLQPNSCLYVQYNFNGRPIIYCYESTFQLLGTFTWSYNNKLYTAPLDQISITTNPASFEGQPANETGVIFIGNNTNPPQTLFVSCQYGF